MAEGPKDRPSEASIPVPGRAVLFGFEATAARADVLPRSRRWRLAGVLQAGVAAVVVAPLAAVVPPHAPWAIGALVAGGVFARRRWLHTHTLVGLHARCPKCAGSFSVQATRLRRPHPLDCDGCHHVSELRLDEHALPTA